MSSILLPFVAKITNERALIAPNLRYCSARGPIKKGCAAIVRAGRGDGNPILYNLAAHHQSEAECRAAAKAKLEKSQALAQPGVNQSAINTTSAASPADILESFAAASAPTKEQSSDDLIAQLLAEHSPDSNKQQQQEPEEIAQTYGSQAAPAAHASIQSATPSSQPTEMLNETMESEAMGEPDWEQDSRQLEAPQERAAPRKDAAALAAQADASAVTEALGAISDSTKGEAVNVARAAGAIESQVKVNKGNDAQAAAVNRGSRRGNVRTLESLSAQQRKILTLSPVEKQSLKDFIYENANQLISKAQGIAKDMIAFAGIQALKSFLPNNAEDYLQQTNNGTKGIDLVVFDQINPVYINYICASLFSKQQAHYQELCKLYPKLKSDKKKNSPLKADSERVAALKKLIDYPNNAFAEHFDSLDSVHIAIPKHIVKEVKELKGQLSKCSFIDKEHKAIYWRDNNLDTGQLILSSIDSTDDQASMKNVRRLRDEHLTMAFLDNLKDFIELNYEHYGLTHYPVCNKDPLLTTLRLLHDNSEFSLSLELIATYAALCLMYYTQEPNMLKALGSALSALHWPCQSNLFNTPNLKSVVVSRFNTVLNNKAASCQCYGRGFDVMGENLRSSVLIENFNDSFSWEGKKTLKSEEDKNAAPDNELIALEPWESGAIKQYLKYLHAENFDDKYHNAFNILCFIEWQNRLNKLFVSDPNKKAPSKPLSVQTIEHFAAERKGQSDDLTDDELDVIYLCDRPANLISTPERTMLYDFYQSKRHVFALAPALDKQWKLIIYAQERYDHENFLLSLCQALLYVINRADPSTKIKLVELNLPLSRNELSKLNFYMLRSFATYFGNALLSLQERSGGLFTLSFAGAQEDDKYYPLINFARYSKHHKLKNCNATSKKANTLKLNLTAYYQDGTKSETLELSWALLPEFVAHGLSKDLFACGSSMLLQYSTYERTIGPDSALLPPLTLKAKSSFNFNQDERASHIFSKDPKEQCNLSYLIDKVHAKGREILSQAHANNPSPVLTELQDKWEQLEVLLKNFSSHYVQCLYGFINSDLSLAHVNELTHAYSKLQYELLSEPLSTHALIKDKARHLLQLLLMVGMSYEDYPLSAEFDEYLSVPHTHSDDFSHSAYLSALATPLCVESLRSLMMKNERMVELLNQILQGKIEFNNQNLFIEHLTLDMNYADNPEQNVRFNCALNTYEPLLAKDNCLGFTLYESTQAHHERFSTHKPRLTAKTGKLELNLSFQEQEYLTEVSNYIENYLKSRPYLMEQCTLMVYYCSLPQLLLALYRELENNKALNKFKFHLVIVNHSFSESQEIYGLFEQEKRRNSHTKSNSSYVQRVVVSVLTDDPLIDNQVVSKFGTFLNSATLHLNATSRDLVHQENLIELGRMADICLLFHVFDNHARYGFTKDNVCVPIVLNETQYQPSLINYAHFNNLLGKSLANSSLAKTNQAGKYLVCPMMAIDRAQLFHSFYYLIERKSDLFASAKAKLSELDYHLSTNKQSPNQSLVPCIGVPLFEQTLDDSKHSPDSLMMSELIEQVQQRSDMVVYFDDLMCRHMLISHDIDVVYYNKLRNYALNFMVASTSSDLNSMYHLQELLEQFKLLKNQESMHKACERIRHDAITISGSILLHAQNKRINVYEMMGLVLSKYLGKYVLRALEHELKAKALLSEPTFVSLDDYAAIFGKKQQLRADIVGLQLYERQLHPDSAQYNHASLFKNTSPQTQERPRYVLALLILESKFFQQPNDKAAAKSISQTQSSTQNFYLALNQNGTALNGDRKIWLSRLADMILSNAHWSATEQEHNQGANFLAVSGDTFVQIQELIRRGQVDIILKGVSCVYACSDEDMTFDKANKSGRLLGPGSNKSQVITQLGAHKNNKGKYPVMQIKIYKDALAHLMKLYLSDDQEHALTYLSKADSNQLITSYLTQVDFISQLAQPEAGPVEAQVQDQSLDATSMALPSKLEAPLVEAQQLELSLEEQQAHDAFQAPAPDSATLEPEAELIELNAKDTPLPQAQAKSDAYEKEDTDTCVPATEPTKLQAGSAVESAAAPELTAKSAETATNLEPHQLTTELTEPASNEEEAPVAPASSPEAVSTELADLDLSDDSLVSPEATCLAEPAALGALDESLTANASATLVDPDLLANSSNETNLLSPEKSATVSSKAPSAKASAVHDASLAWDNELSANIVGSESLESEDPFGEDLLTTSESKDVTNPWGQALSISAMPNLEHANTQASPSAAPLTKPETVPYPQAAQLIEPPSPEIKPHEAQPLDNQPPEGHPHQMRSAQSLNAWQHHAVKSLPPRFVSLEERKAESAESTATVDSAPVVERNLELEEFWLEHPRMQHLVAQSTEHIDFNNPETLQFVKDNEHNLITGLKKSGLRPVLKNSKITANGAIFSFEGNDNFEIAKIKRITDKLLTTYGVDICSIRGKSREIDIYIKSEKRIKVPYFALLSARKFNYDYYEVAGQRYRGYNSQFILGLGEETGQVVYLDLRAEQPHTLIAGSTGSGKSVLLNCLILDMAITNLPQELELVLVDPKMGAEFGIFEDLPHLKQRGIITDKEQALDKLKELTELMDMRYVEIQEFGRFMKDQTGNMRAYVRNIDDYNKYCCAYERGRMGRIFFIMDEFADWFSDKEFKNTATEYIQRITQKARATGIHVILATQRPDAKIMDSNIKSQLGNRIALKTSDRVNSQIILDDKELDASALSGRGHMICKFSTTNYAQSGFVSDENIYEIIEAICQDYQERLAISQ